MSEPMSLGKKIRGILTFLLLGILLIVLFWGAVSAVFQHGVETGRSQVRHIDNGEADDFTVFETNYDHIHNLTGKIKKVRVHNNVYQLGYIVYTDEFAEKYSYPKKYVVDDMPNGVEVIEFRLETETGSPNCRFNMLLDNDLGLDLPAHDMYAREYSQKLRIWFPEGVDTLQVPTDPNEIQAIQDFFNLRRKIGNEENRLGRNIILMGKNDEGRQKYLQGFPLDEFSKTYYRNLDYLSLSTPCGSLITAIFSFPETAIWIKKGKDKKYIIDTSLEERNVERFIFPKSFVETIRPFLKKGEIDSLYKKLYLENYFKTVNKGKGETNE